MSFGYPIELVVFIDKVDDWEDYKPTVLATELNKFTDQSIIKRHKSFSFIGNAALFVTGLLVLGIFIFSKTKESESIEPEFSYEVLPSDGFSKKVKVSYDISRNNFGNASLMYESQRIHLNDVVGDTTFTVSKYYDTFVVYRSIKLFLDDSLVAKRKLFLTSDEMKEGFGRTT
jgi:hypothetical protein